MTNDNKKIILATLMMGILSGCTALVPNSILRAIHQDMDKNLDGYIDYSEYLHNSSNNNVEQKAKEKGMTVEEYQKWDFNRADTDRDGKVTEQEIIDLFRK